MLNRLELAPAIRTGAKHPNGTYKSERHFLDFVIDGQSLWVRVAKRRDMISPLCLEFALEESVRSANRLLLIEEADFSRNRRSLFVCSECGDLGCGAISVSVIKEGEAIVWTDFGLQNTYEEKIELAGYENFAPFKFDSASYERAFLQAIDSLRIFRSK